MSTPGTALKPIDEVRGALDKMQPQFKMALPPQVSPEKFQRVVLTALQNNPDLLNANRQSLYAAAMKAAQEGLLPDGKESALVTFGGTVSYLPMVGGILKKVRNSGELATLTAQIIYKGDKFRYWVDADGEHLNHEPDFFGERGEAIGTYAMAKTKDGAFYIEVLTAKDVEAIRQVSRSKNGPWAGPFKFEMWKKSAIKRLAKRLPSSTDLEDSLKDIEDDFEPMPREMPPTEVEVKAEPAPRKSRVNAAVKQAEEPKPAFAPGPVIPVQDEPEGAALTDADIPL